MPLCLCERHMSNREGNMEAFRPLLESKCKNLPVTLYNKIFFKRGTSTTSRCSSRTLLKAPIFTHAAGCAISDLLKCDLLRLVDIFDKSFQMGRKRDLNLNERSNWKSNLHKVRWRQCTHNMYLRFWDHAAPARSLTMPLAGRQRERLDEPFMSLLIRKIINRNKRVIHGQGDPFSFKTPFLH